MSDMLQLVVDLNNSCPPIELILDEGQSKNRWAPFY